MQNSILKQSKMAIYALVCQETKTLHKTSRKSSLSIHSHQNLFLILCISPSSTNVFVQLEHYIELLLHWQNQYQGLLCLKMPLARSNTHISLISLTKYGHLW